MIRISGSHSLGHCPARDPTPAERIAFRQVADDIRDAFAFYSMLPLIWLAMAVITPRFMEDEEECGNCREPMSRCGCIRSDA